MNDREGLQENDDHVEKICYRAKVASGLYNAFTPKQFSIAAFYQLSGALCGHKIHPLMPNLKETTTTGRC